MDEVQPSLILGGTAEEKKKKKKKGTKVSFSELHVDVWALHAMMQSLKACPVMGNFLV